MHESPAFDAQDRIYCVPWCRRDKFTNRLIVDKATWREAFDHKAFHSQVVQGSASGVHGRPHWAEAYRAVSSCLVARGLIGHFDKESTPP
ncbi:hypothetical protein JCM13580A_43160 [Streptomyces drozdowiczii]